MIIHGLKSCDTTKKALRALQEAGGKLRDVRENPLSGAEIARFYGRFGDRLVNRASTTWRGLSDAGRARDPAALLADHPTLMKRPVIEDGDRLTLGWSATEQAEWLG